MALKSTQTNKYETACFIQEAARINEDYKGYKLKKSVCGQPFVEFRTTLWSFGHDNRMGRRYDPVNCRRVIETDERIQRLKMQHKWRGELNHPNPEIRGQQFSDIRMTIPEQRKSSHIIFDDEFVGDLYKANIRTLAGTQDGISATCEIVDNNAIPSFSVRLLGNMVPNASHNQPNMRVNKVITFDMVDYPSHQEADADIPVTPTMESANIVYLKDFAKYCAENDENTQVVMESFELSMDELMGIQEGTLKFEQKDGSKIWLPLKGDIRKEALNFLRGGF